MMGMKLGFLWCCTLLPLSFALSSVELRNAGTRTCSVSGARDLVSFSGESAKLSLPCKYALADFTCGKYRVKVTPGNGQDFPFTPVTVRTKLVDTESGEQLKARTSLGRLNRYLKGKTNNIWESKEGNLTDLDVMGYDATVNAIRVQKSGVFDVTWSDGGDVAVTCEAVEFTSQPVPDTLCGDGTNTAAIQESFSELFGDNPDATLANYVNYLMLDDQTVTQSKTCVAIATKFQSCEKKTEAVTLCDVILNDASRFGCLAESATPLENYYSDCVTSVCDDDASLLEGVNGFINDNCENVEPIGQAPVTVDECPVEPPKDWFYTTCLATSDCELLAQNSYCRSGRCMCPPGRYHSESSGCCVSTCSELGNFTAYVGAFFNATEGFLRREEDPPYTFDPCVNSCWQDDQCLTVTLYQGEDKTICDFYSVLPNDPSGTIINDGGWYDYVFQRKCK